MNKIEISEITAKCVHIVIHDDKGNKTLHEIKLDSFAEGLEFFNVTVNEISKTKIIEYQLNKARQVLLRLSRSPQSFIRSFPANHDIDSDLIISDALDYANQMRVALEEIANQSDMLMTCCDAGVRAKEIARKALTTKI